MKAGLGPILLFVALLSLLLSLSPASCLDDLNDIGLTSQGLNLHLGISTSLTIVPISEDFLIKSVAYQLNYMPLDTWQQRVISKSIEPEPTLSDESLYFSWEDPTSNNLSFSISSELSLKNDLIRVTKKIPFPLANLPQEVIPYTLPSQNVNSDDPKITALASELASGKDDLNQVAFALFAWVADNIQYRKTPETELIAQSATWVLANRYGVCDELSTIYMALARSLGIPARYVSGLAYSNLPEIADWQPHGWVKLYYPGYGWVPVDPTYREFGFIDPTHITLRQSLDSNDTTSLVKWVGRGVELEKSPLFLGANLQSRSGKASDLVSLELEPITPKLGLGSYGLLKARVTNKNPFYVYTDVILLRILGLNVIGNETRAVLLKPQESREVFWLIQVGNGLDSRYLYTFPLMARTTRNTTASGELDVWKDYAINSEEAMRAQLDTLEKEEPLTISNNLGLNCSLAKSTIYLYENLSIRCALSNLGNSFLKNINLCLGKDCRALELPIAHSIEQSFTFSPAKPGRFEGLVTAKSPAMSARAGFSYSVFDTPNLTIDELSHPDRISFGQGYNITLKLKKNSDSTPSNVTLLVQTPRKQQKFEFGPVSADKLVIVNIGPNGLREGANNLSLSLSYRDLNGRSYLTKTPFTITQETDSFYQKVLLVIFDFVSWLESIVGQI